MREDEPQSIEDGSIQDEFFKTMDCRPGSMVGADQSRRRNKHRHVGEDLAVGAR
jgi:hypothetical protein